jgi:hypothetical protein
MLTRDDSTPTWQQTDFQETISCLQKILNVIMIFRALPITIDVT